LSPEREQAELLLRKAAEDQTVLVALARNLEIADAALGFHAQQAVEKALKAVLAAHGDDFPWTHDLQLLLRRLEAVSVDLPTEVRAARALAPWAVEYRYGETVDADLDRPATVSLVAQVLDWATAQAQVEP
jgi:HEPN domain-containing protein